MPYWLGVLVGITFAVVLGLVFERVIIRNLAGRPDLQTVSTLALFLLTQCVVFIVPAWGNTWGQLFPSPLLGKNVEIPGANYSVSYDQILLLGVGIAVFVGLRYLLKRPGWAWQCVRCPTTPPPHRSWACGRARSHPWCGAWPSACPG